MDISKKVWRSPSTSFSSAHVRLSTSRLLRPRIWAPRNLFTGALTMGVLHV